MDKLSRLSPDQRANLVAYLDGELDDGSVKEIETVLTQSPVARNDVELLARTYELLNALPRVEAAPEFTVRTMTAIAAPEAKPDITETEGYKKVKGWIQVAVLGLICAASGAVAFGAVRYWSPRPYDSLLDELPVLRELHRYQEIGDFEFVRSNLANDTVIYPQIKEEVARERR